jgi:hypothetical protein
MVVHTPAPVSGQEMEALIEKLIEENKKISKPLETNDFPDMSHMNQKFSVVYGEAIDPFLLKTYVERSNTTFNVYWKTIDEASEYRVEVYKYVTGVWYKLSDINIDRNTGYISINDLVGNGYIFRVVAEDRNGNILSRSAGMIIGYNTTE